MQEELVTQLSGALRRLARVRHSLPMGGLPMGEFFMLQLIQRREGTGTDRRKVYVSQLTQCTHVSAPAVSRTLRRLEGKGLVQRQTDPEDRRTTYVVLTGEGLALLEVCRQQMEELGRRVAARMGSEELSALAAQLDRLTDTVQEEWKKMSVE